MAAIAARLRGRFPAPSPDVDARIETSGRSRSASVPHSHRRQVERRAPAATERQSCRTTLKRELWMVMSPL